MESEDDDEEEEEGEEQEESDEDNDDDDDDDDEEDEKQSGEDDFGAMTPRLVDLNEFDVGWHPEMGLGWRNPKNASQTQKEFSLAPNPLAAAAGDSPLLVEFLDGTSAIMPITVSAFKAVNYSRCFSMAEVILEAEHKETHHKISVRQKRDRQLLICMFDQGKQILQIRADRFGDGVQAPLDDGGGPPLLAPDHLLIEKAKQFFKPILQDYVSSKLIDKSSLYEARASRAKEMGIALVARKSKKPDDATKKVVRKEEVDKAVKKEKEDENADTAIDCPFEDEQNGEPKTGQVAKEKEVIKPVGGKVAKKTAQAAKTAAAAKDTVEAAGVSKAQAAKTAAAAKDTAVAAGVAKAQAAKTAPAAEAAAADDDKAIRATLAARLKNAKGCSGFDWGAKQQVIGENVADDEFGIWS